MLFLRFLLFLISVSFVVVAAGLVIYDVFLAFELERLLRPGESASQKDETAQTSETVDLGAVPVAARGAIQAPVRIARTRRVVRWAAVAKLVAVAALLSLLSLIHI